MYRYEHHYRSWPVVISRQLKGRLRPEDGRITSAGSESGNTEGQLKKRKRPPPFAGVGSCFPPLSSGRHGSLVKRPLNEPIFSNLQVVVFRPAAAKPRKTLHYDYSLCTRPMQMQSSLVSEGFRLIVHDAPPRSTACLLWYQLFVPKPQ